MRSPKLFTLLTALALVAVVAVQVDAQQGRPQGGRGQGRPGGGGFPGGGFGGPGGGGKLSLLGRDEVKKELELLDEQNADIEKLAEAAQAQRSSAFADIQNLPEGERRAAFEKLQAERNALSEEERDKQDAERRAQRDAQQAEAEAKLAEILLPHQLDRLTQIEIQQQGIGALLSDEVAKELGLSDAVKADIESTVRAIGEKSRTEIQAQFQSGNREGIREKMEGVQKEIETAALAKLTQSQRDKFADMKGEPFELPRLGFGGGPGGPGGQRQRGGNGGQGGGRPQRPAE